MERELRKPLPDAKSDEREETPDDEYQLEYKLALEKFPAQWMMVAGQDMLLTLIAARELLLIDEQLAAATFDLRVNTRLGWVALTGSQDDEHDYRGPVALIIDIGGDDTYTQAGGNADRKHAVSVALDWAGNDLYQALPDEFASFGAGALGVGILWDEAGDDIYDADRRTQGCGVFGVGVLVDRAGRDTYRAISDAQGSATGGLRRAGRHGRRRLLRVPTLPRRRSPAPNAAATLIDLAGNDEYVANDSEIRFPSSQNAEHNTSMCQGAGHW